MTQKERRLADALQVLIDLGMPRAQQNERSAVSLLALLDLRPGQKWHQAANPMIGITPIMLWAKQHYDKEYALNRRSIPKPINHGPLPWPNRLGDRGLGRRRALSPDPLQRRALSRPLRD